VMANHKMVDESYPFYLGATFKAGYRAQAIEERLKDLFNKSQTRKIKRGDMLELLNSVRSIPAVQFTVLLCGVSEEETSQNGCQSLWPLLSQVQRAFLNWNGNLNKDSRKATLYQFIHAEIVDMLLKEGLKAVADSKKINNDSLLPRDMTTDQFVAQVGGHSFDSLKMVKMLNELQGRLHFNVLKMLGKKEESWWITNCGGWTRVISMAVQNGFVRLWRHVHDAEPAENLFSDPNCVSQLLVHQGARWGSVHRCDLQHPISKKLGLLPGTKPLDAPSMEMGGDTNTIAQSSNTEAVRDLSANGTNVSLKVLIDLSKRIGDVDSGINIITPVGQSGQFNSKWYCDQRETFLQGQIFQVSFDSVSISAGGTMNFVNETGRKVLGWVIAPIVVAVLAICVLMFDY